MSKYRIMRLKKLPKERHWSFDKLYANRICPVCRKKYEQGIEVSRRKDDVAVGRYLIFIQYPCGHKARAVQSMMTRDLLEVSYE